MQENNRNLVSFAIESVLMQRGGDRYFVTLFRLRNKFDCEFVDCYDNPQHLRSVLTDVYGNLYDSIVEDIRSELGDTSTNNGIRSFLLVLESK